MVNNSFYLLFVSLVFRCFHQFENLINNSKSSRLLSSEYSTSSPHTDQIAIPLWTKCQLDHTVKSLLSQNLFVVPVCLACCCLTVTVDSVSFLYVTLLGKLPYCLSKGFHYFVCLCFHVSLITIVIEWVPFNL